MAKRKDKEQFFLNHLEEMVPGTDNVQRYKEYFKTLNDKQFDDLMKKMATGEVVLPFYVPNMSNVEISTERLIKAAKKLGANPIQRYTLDDPATGIRIKTTKAFPILPIRVRRQQQHMEKKRSIAENTKYTDPLTGQVVGVSKASSLSLPETMIMQSGGWNKGLEEMLKVRGGDLTAYRQAKQDIIATGGYRLEAMENLGSRATSTDTFKAILFAMMFENNL